MGKNLRIWKLPEHALQIRDIIDTTLFCFALSDGGLMLERVARQNGILLVLFSFVLHKFKNGYFVYACETNEK